MKLILRLLLGLLLLSATWLAHTQQMSRYPAYVASVNKALAPAALRDHLATVSDPKIRLGLAYLAPGGSPVRAEIGRELPTSEKELRRAHGVLQVMLDEINPALVEALVTLDPENGLGHYLAGNLAFRENRDDEALAAFRRGAACKEIRCYEALTSAGLKQALQSLGFNPRERLGAISWLASRKRGFSTKSMQETVVALTTLAYRDGDGRRREAADLLLTLAGQLYVGNFYTREYADRALQTSFRFKAELAALEKAPEMNSYAAVAQALVSVAISWPGIDDGPMGMQVARSLPSLISTALAVTESETEEFVRQLRLYSGVEAHPDFGAAKQRLESASERLLALAIPKSDAILGYLTGVGAEERDAGPWVSKLTDVEKAMVASPELFRAGRDVMLARMTLNGLRQNTDLGGNIQRLMRIGKAIQRYAAKNDSKFPERLSQLYEDDFLKESEKAVSMLTEKPYRYVGTGVTVPRSVEDGLMLVLLYDEQEVQDGRLACYTAAGAVQLIKASEVQEQLSNR